MKKSHSNNRNQVQLSVFPPSVLKQRQHDHGRGGGSRAVLRAGVNLLHLSGPVQWAGFYSLWTQLLPGEMQTSPKTTPKFTFLLEIFQMWGYRRTWDQELHPWCFNDQSDSTGDGDIFDTITFVCKLCEEVWFSPAAIVTVYLVSTAGMKTLKLRLRSDLVPYLIKPWICRSLRSYWDCLQFISSWAAALKWDPPLLLLFSRHVSEVTGRPAWSVPVLCASGSLMNAHCSASTKSSLSSLKNTNRFIMERPVYLRPPTMGRRRWWQKAPTRFWRRRRGHRVGRWCGVTSVQVWNGLLFAPVSPALPLTATSICSHIRLLPSTPNTRWWTPRRPSGAAPAPHTTAYWRWAFCPLKAAAVAAETFGESSD